MPGKCIATLAPAIFPPQAPVHRHPPVIPPPSRCAMCRDTPYLVRHAWVIQDFGGQPCRRPIRLTAHNNYGMCRCHTTCFEQGTQCTRYPWPAIMSGVRSSWIRAFLLFSDIFSCFPKLFKCVMVWLIRSIPLPRCRDRRARVMGLAMPHEFHERHIVDFYRDSEGRIHG